jgi:lipopolysaccharide/colanic/teichoic acid biosynthesis glycosyltransferase
MLEQKASVPAPAWPERLAQIDLVAPPRESYSLAVPPSAAYRLAKRVLDSVVSFSVLVLASPVLLLVALLIRMTSPGPVIYRQRRVGKGGRIFTMYKFRSMYQNADHTLHQKAYSLYVRGSGGYGKVDRETLAELASPAAQATHADATPRQPWSRLLTRLRAAITPEDPRITPIGHLIRRTSLDEFPQLFNVLIGDMSLVGPRPPIPYEVRLYTQQHLGRLAVTPGVTGMWQIYGRGRVPFDRMVEMDLHYIARRSFWLDLRLLLLTIPSVLFSRGAK